MRGTRIEKVLAALAIACSLSPIARADVTNGERLARQWCANCHVIDAGGPSATLPQGPPSFRVAAGHLNPEQLRAFLTHPHGQMPDLALTRSEIDDLIAYIELHR
jgi:mono/diheme cytochrome c family protein